MAELLKTDQPVKPVKLSAERPQGEESPRRIASYLAVGAAAIYLATWTGCVTFYLSFQKPLLDVERGRGHGILWFEPRSAPDADKEAWSSREVDGVQIPMPPGRVVEVKGERNLIRAKLEDGEFTVERHPTGFIAELYRDNLELLGVKREGVPRDAAALEDIARESLERYQFRWPEADRQLYAARLLSKMSLWDTGPVARCELASREGSSAVLVGYATGQAKVIATGPGGVMVIVIPAKAPAAWKASPASWLR